MKHLFITLSAVTLFLCYCHYPSKDKVYIYDLVSPDLKTIQENILTVRYHLLDSNIYSVILNGRYTSYQTQPYKNQEAYKIKVTDDGLYIGCKEGFKLAYPFDSAINHAPICEMSLPHINNEITYAKNKFFFTYNIIRYTEVYASHSGQDSYYLKDFGFLCYDDIAAYDNFILCRHARGTNFSDVEIQQIGDALIRDTLFFTKYVLKKRGLIK